MSIHVMKPGDIRTVFQSIARVGRDSILEGQVLKSNLKILTVKFYYSFLENKIITSCTLCFKNTNEKCWFNILKFSQLTRKKILFK